MPSVTLGPFSIETADGWTLSTVIVAGPAPPTVEGDGTSAPARPFQPNLVVTCETVAADVTTEVYYERQVAGLRAAGVGRRDVARPENVPLAGDVIGLLTEQVVLGGAGDRVRQLQLIRVHDGLAVTAIASNADGPPFEGSRDQFRAMLTSLS